MAIGVMEAGSSSRMNYSSAKMALRSGTRASEDTVQTERNRLPEDSNHYKIENEQLRDMILEKDTALRAMPTYSKDM